MRRRLTSTRGKEGKKLQRRRCNGTGGLGGDSKTTVCKQVTAEVFLAVAANAPSIHVCTVPTLWRLRDKDLFTIRKHSRQRERKHHRCRKVKRATRPIYSGHIRSSLIEKLVAPSFVVCTRFLH